jgi:hypothetical protein
MAINFANSALPTRQAAAVGNARERKVAHGSYEITDSGPMAANSIIYMCKIPKGAVITGGRVLGDPIDSSGSGSALASIHVGINGGFTAGDGTVYTASTATACLVSSLPLGPDAVAVAGYKATNTRNFPFGGLVVTNGPLLVSDDCLAFVTFTASALALGTGTLAIEVEYYASTTA